MHEPWGVWWICIVGLCHRLGILTVNHFNGLSRIHTEDVVVLCTQLGWSSLRESEGVCRKSVHKIDFVFINYLELYQISLL